MFGLILAAASSIGSAVAAGCAAIGGALGSACGAIGGVLSAALSMAPNILSAACEIIGGIAKILNLIPHNAEVEQDMQDMGLRIEKSDLKSEEFSSAKEYINHLRNNIEVSRDEINALSDDNKKAHQIVGASLIAKGITEEFTVDIPTSFWMAAALSSVSPVQAHKILNGYQAMNMPVDLESFVKRDMSVSDNKSVYEILASALGSCTSETTPKTPGEFIADINAASKQG